MRSTALAALLLVSTGFAFAAETNSETVHISFAKRAEIGFAPGAEVVPAVVRPQLAQVARELKGALTHEPATVEVEAHAPTPEARILALQRAVDVRGALVDDGVPAARINVLVVRTGAPDTVIIYFRRH